MGEWSRRVGIGTPTKKERTTDQRNVTQRNGLAGRRTYTHTYTYTLEDSEAVRQSGSQARERERNNYYLRPIGAERLTILLLPARRVPHRDCSRDEGHIKVTSSFLNEILPSARRAPFPAGGVL